MARPLNIAPVLTTAKEALCIAGQHVDTFVSQDKGYPELAQLLNATSSSHASLSGISDVDYPALSSAAVGLADLPQLSPAKRVPLPPELVEQFGHMQCNCMMGVFPQISRAWLSVDSDIFVWNYEDGGDLAYFDGLSETILCAGLVQPKPNIFRSHIRFLLCLATPVEIVLLGVSFTQPHEDVGQNDYSRCEMHLLPDPLFSIQTDNTYMLSVKSTPDGRIFLAGKDGCLYEIVYQAQDGWFSRKCRKVNHSSSSLSFLVPSFLTFSEEDPVAEISIDDSRHILYTRSEKGTIQVYDMGSDGCSMRRVTALSHYSMMKHAMYYARTIDRSNFKHIVHIAAIPSTESSRLHLVAVTQTGVRLYFTTIPYQGGWIAGVGARDRPVSLTLVHIRLPPGFTANSAQHRPTNVHAALYSQGALLLCASQGEDSDLLWCLNPDSFPFQRSLMETQVTHMIDSRTWVIEEVPAIPILTPRVDPTSDKPRVPDPPSVVTQHTVMPPAYVLLSSKGSYLVGKLRPVDQLRQLMLNNMGPDNPVVESFFKLHKEDQACATCLILACSRASSDVQVSEWATHAFFLYGGVARLRSYGAPPPNPTANLFGSTTPVVGQRPDSQYGTTLTSPPTSGLQPSIASTPLQASGGYQDTPRTSAGPSAQPSSDVEFSGKFKGLCLYFGRITRPLWELLVAVEVTSVEYRSQRTLLVTNFDSSELSWVLDEMKALKQFLDRNSQYTAVAESIMSAGMPSFARPESVIGRPGVQYQREQTQMEQAEAENAERKALQQLEHLINSCCEVLALLKLLCYHQFHNVTAALPQETRDQLKRMTLRDLVINGKEVCDMLITALINFYTGDNATTDAISSKLRDICPSLYSREDAICSKANELIKGAQQAQTRSVKEKMLKESLQLFKSISQQLILTSVCSEYHQAHFYDGVVELSLSAAARRDPQNLALHYYKHGKPAEDLQGTQAFTARYECYKCVIDILDELLVLSQAHPTSPVVPTHPGPPPQPDPNQLSSQDAKAYMEEIMQKALASDDELFHVALYDWLIEKGLKDRLLQISSPYVEEYMKRATQYSADSLQLMDLLWKYHEKTGNYPAAARILLKLAERHSTDVKLQQRIEYLSRAVMCAKSSNLRTSTSSEGEFLQELEDKLEVARLQLQVYEAIARHSTAHPRFQEALSKLNVELVDITKLYGEFADVFDLSECQLAIIHCAGHYDQQLVQSLWQQIIDKELNESMDKPGDSRMTILAKKLQALGRIYSSLERYFPLAFLILFLEKRSCELRWQSDWVFRCFRDIGIPLPKLLNVYDSLFKAKDPHWQTSPQPLHLLIAICALVKAFTDSPSCVPVHERRQFVSVCLDAIAHYKVELEATTGMPQPVQSILNNFKQLQAKLDRLQITKP
ncbi:nuclear pore complex protein Nup155-like [Acanthaster planci]|uniref:Nuclear pore complex protein Nup155 n=1 Tax=Acanthaster planci TaxID=133434 RepID=A0A8B7Y428_ACAPL|nr:nuclear pore complex protein Nup155-like [Acanthaster planci]